MTGSAPLPWRFCGGATVALALAAAIAPSTRAAGPATATELAATVDFLLPLSVVDKGGARIEIDLANEDPLEPWRVDAIELLDAEHGTQILVFYRGTKTSILDGDPHVLAPGEAHTGLLPVPRGYLHRDLVVRVHGRTLEGVARTRSFGLTKASLDALSVVSAPVSAPGPVSADQAAFLAAWQANEANKGPAGADAKAYAELKAQYLQAKGGQAP